MPVPVPVPVPETSDRQSFDFEKLDVYQVSLDYWETAVDAVDLMPAGKAFIADQLQRAALSIGLNIAEGAGEFSKQEKARFYRMARRSATECVAVLNACSRAKLLPIEQAAIGRKLLQRLVAMLTKLILHWEQTAAKERIPRAYASRKTPA